MGHQFFQGHTQRSRMQVVKAITICLAAAFYGVAAQPALLVGHHGLAYHGLAHHGLAHHAVGGQTSHQAVTTAHGEQRSLVQSKALGATHSSVSQADNSKGLIEVQQPSVGANRVVPVGHAAVVPLTTHAVHSVPTLTHHAVAHGVHPIAHAVHAAPVVHAAPSYIAPAPVVVAHPAPTYLAPAKKMPAPAYLAPAVAKPAYHTPAPAYHAPAPSYHAPASYHPYSYTYAVADDYSKATFSQKESNDGTGLVQGTYSVNLPDGRIQTVNYHANDIDGYVAEVTYSGEAVYPDTPASHPVSHAVVKPTYHAPAPAYHAPAPAYHAPVVHAAHAVAHHAVAHPIVHHSVAHPVAHVAAAHVSHSVVAKDPMA